MSIHHAPQVQSLNQSPFPGRTRRPFGLKALIVLLILQSLLGIVMVASIWLAYPLIVAQSSTPPEPLASQIGNLIAYATLAVSRLLVAVGLWRLRRWAWVLVMVQLAGSMAQDIQTYYTGQPLYFSMLLNVVLVFYLNQHEVQNLFTTPEERETT